MLRQWNSECRDIARGRLPLPDDQFQALFDMLERELPIHGCDHSRRKTKGFLESQGLPINVVLAWLDNLGGFCDCEVLANVEEHWRWCRGEG